jgi:uncharacterized membrane protein
MTRFLKICSAITYCALVLLLFLLLFQQKVAVPVWLQAVGRMHPLLLHLPIGMFIIAALLWLLKKYFEAAGFQKLFSFLLHLVAVTTALTALFGFLLSKEGGYNEATLRLHKWTGVLLSIITAILLYLYQYGRGKKLIFNAVLAAGTVMLILAGHWGATLTHGDNFVWQPFQKTAPEAPLAVTENTPLFAAAVQPVLKTKCYSCHNENKTKGGLIMTNEAALLKGGKSGPLWIPGNAAASRLIEYINLPEGDKKHMPPAGKPQLTADEKSILFAWIQSGADFKKPLKAYPATDTLSLMAAKFTKTEPALSETAYSFSPASANTLQKINTPFCSVTPLSVNSPALAAAFFVKARFDVKKLEALSAVKEQLVSLSLDNMPVTDGDLLLLTGFTNLEKLNLNNTNITGKILIQLKGLKKLSSLSLSGTKVDNSINSLLTQLPALKEVYLWNTPAAASIASLQGQFKNIHFNSGFIPDPSEILKLNVPVLKNENPLLEAGETVTLTHTLPGVQIRYTTNGSLPDSNQGDVYTKPLLIKGFTPLKAIAVKEGWYASDVMEYNFFQKGFTAQNAELLIPPNKDYPGTGAATLIDGKKGIAADFKSPEWLGCREQPFSALIFFSDPAPAVNSVTISFNRNIGSYIMPPAVVEVWAGSDRQHLTLLKTVKPAQPVKIETAVVEGISIALKGAAYKCYKIFARPVNPLPPWHPGKGDKGWVFIDEIFFN